MQKHLLKLRSFINKCFQAERGGDDKRDALAAMKMWCTMELLSHVIPGGRRMGKVAGTMIA